MSHNEEPPISRNAEDKRKLLDRSEVIVEDVNPANNGENLEKNQRPEVEPGEIDAEKTMLVENLQKLDANTAKVEPIDSSEHSLPLQILIAKMKNAGDKFFSTLKRLAQDENSRRLIQEVVLPGLVAGLGSGGFNVSKFQNGSMKGVDNLPDEVRKHLEAAGDLKTKAGIMLRNRPEAQSFSPKNLFDQFRGEGVKSGLDWEGGKRRVASNSTNLLLGAGANLAGHVIGNMIEKRFGKK